MALGLVSTENRSPASLWLSLRCCYHHTQNCCSGLLSYIHAVTDPVFAFAEKQKWKMYGFLCGLFAVPSGILGALSLLDDQGGKYASITSLGQLAGLWKANPLHARIGSVSFGFMSWSSFTLVTASFLRDAWNEIKNLWLKEESSNKKRLRIAFFIWSLGTGLIFGALGALALSFLGPVGMALGFVSNFWVFFSSRYMSLMKVMHLDTLKEMLLHDDRHWVTFVINCLLAATVILPVYIVYSPYAVIGAEIIANAGASILPWVTAENISIGANDHYFNLASILLGSVCSTPTVIFFGLYAFMLSDKFIEIVGKVSEVWDKFTNKERASVVLLLAACAVFSVGTSFGWTKPSDSLKNAGHYFYLQKAKKYVTGSVIAVSAETYVTILLKLADQFVVSEMVAEAKKREPVRSQAAVYPSEAGFKFSGEGKGAEVDAEAGLAAEVSMPPGSPR